MDSYASGTSTIPLLGQTIGQSLHAAAARMGSHEALVDRPSGRRWTCRAARLGRGRRAGLLAKGVRKGDRVGIWSPNCAEWVAAQYATALIGAILVDITRTYRTSELAYVVNQSGLELLLSATAFKTSDYRGMVEEVRPGVASLREGGLHRRPDLGRPRAVRSGDPDGAVEEASAELSFDDPINIQYTSGTTGFPKGATLSHHNILNNGHFVGGLLAYTEPPIG